MINDLESSQHSNQIMKQSQSNNSNLLKINQSEHGIIKRKKMILKKDALINQNNRPSTSSPYPLNLHGKIS